MPDYKPLRQWLREKHLTAPNTLSFIDGLESDLEELSAGLGVKVKLVTES